MHIHTILALDIFFNLRISSFFLQIIIILFIRLPYNLNLRCILFNGQFDHRLAMPRLAELIHRLHAL